MKPPKTIFEKSEKINDVAKKYEQINDDANDGRDDCQDRGDQSQAETTNNDEPTLFYLFLMLLVSPYCQGKCNQNECKTKKKKIHGNLPDF